MSSSSKRDSLSPASGTSLHRAPSSDSLNAHPLLSPNSPSFSNRDTSATTPPRYVPYTPRHKPLVSSATTGMTTHASMPVTTHRNQEGGATSKLQLQNLKASSQGIGLGNGTLGWAMLERLVDAETSGEWDEIWTVLTTAKPTLLLPLEPFSGELITPEFIKDHLAFCNGHASSSSPLVTVSGLRGFIIDSVLTFKSTIAPSSASFVDLFKPELQTLALASLPPLPSTRLSDSGTLFPSIALPATASLPIPPRPYSRAPPRPGASSSTPPKSQGGSRITKPFASLFGRPPLSNASTSSLSLSQGQLHSDDTQNAGSVDLVAFSLGKKITKQSVGKEMSKAIKDEIKAHLSRCPTWVIDRVLDFTGPLHPIPRTSRRMEARHNARPQAPPSTQLPDPSSLAEAFQSFYVSIEDELRAAVPENLTSERTMTTARKINQTQSDSGAAEKEPSEDGNEGESGLKENVNPDMNIKEILEQVESAICTVFYDRTFRPLAGDDASHDDALANRIAALSLLDLGLEHLGVEIPNGTARSDVDNVIKSCGELLQTLEDSQHRSPKEKSALLVEAHQKLVEGISRLPQLRLKPESDAENQDLEQETPRAASFGKQVAKEAIERTPASLTTSHAGRELNGDTETVKAETTPEGALATMSQSEAEPTPEPTDIPPESLVHVHKYEFAQDPAKVSFVGISSSPTTSPRLHSPTLVSRSPVAAPISGDLLFPLLIFSVVKANPPHLVSHLLYTQRFRSRRVGGQESYCLINLMAVVEFLEHVDMGALGLGDSERVMSTADLTPIPLAHGSLDSSTTPSSPLASRLGRRVNQQVEELAGLAGSANRVITGVVDSSFGVLRGFLAPNPDLSMPHNDTQDPAPWNHPRPGFGLLRRGPGFSIASVTASLPGAGRPRTPAGGAGEEGQQLIEVPSRPGSIREANVEDERDEEDTTGSSVESSDESREGDVVDRDDSRSVRSFSSMLNRENRDRDRVDNKERVSLTDRLANMSSFSRLGSGEQHAAKPSPPPSLPTSRPTSWLPSALATQPADTPVPSVNSSVSRFRMRIPPPNRRFLECAENDIRVGEVSELLHEYRRLAHALQTAGAFEDHA